MATQRLTCPECDRVLKVDDSIPAGKKIRCPRCSTVFAVPGRKRRVEEEEVEVEVDQDADEEAPARSRKRGRAAKQARGKSPVLLLALGGVAVLLLVGGGIALLVWIKSGSTSSASAGATAGGGLPAGWQTFTPPGGGYSVAMPGTPKKEDQDEDGEVYSLKLDGGRTTYVVGTYKDSTGKKSAEQLLAEMVRSWRQGAPGGKFIGERNATLGGANATELEGEDPAAGHIFMRICVVKDLVYMIAFGGPKNAPSPPEMKTFFESLKFTNR